MFDEWPECRNHWLCGGYVHRDGATECWSCSAESERDFLAEQRRKELIGG